MKSTIHEHQKNSFNQVSKTTIKKIGLLFLTAIALASCTPNEDEVTTTSKIQNVSPLNGKSFSADEASQPITFRWTPVVPKPQTTVTYRLKVWQLMQGQNGQQAMRSNQPIIVKDVDNFTEIILAELHNGPCKPPYLCDFIWAVEVINSNGSSQANSNPTVFNF